MQLTLLDWLAIAAYFAANVAIGLYYRRRATASTADYFVSGRNVSWWLAGTSMVATTFAADTPLAVTGLVASFGIAGNWLWWSMLMSGMLTVFFYARLWRRAGVLTDVEFAEIRYAGRPAAFLRGFRALYLGLPINLIIMGWVNLAMVKILVTIFGVTKVEALAGRLRDDARHRLHLDALRPLGRPRHGPLPVRPEDGDGDRARRLRGGRGGRDGGAEGEAPRPGPGPGGRGRRRRLDPLLHPGRRLRLDADADLLRLRRGELVGHLVPGGRAGRGRLRRAADLLREGREALAPRHPLVQRRPLRGAPLALDPHRPREPRPLPRPRGQGVGLREDDRGPRRLPGGAARGDDRRLRRGLHVHDRHPAQLGRLLPGERLLPALPRAGREREALRARLAGGDRPPDAGLLRRDLVPGVDRGGVDVPHRGGGGNGERLHPAVVLVAHQRLERGLGHGRLVRGVGPAAGWASACAATTRASSRGSC